jgi:hypothetical protein
MRRGLSIILLGFLIFTASPVLAEDPSSLHIQGVIQQQLKAFNADDYPAAYRYASKHIQSKFALDEFKAMVQTGYPQIARSLRTSFGEIAFSEGRTHAVAHVDVTGADHVTVQARYRMVLEDGSWKIDGVILQGRTNPVHNLESRPHPFERVALIF